MNDIPFGELYHSEPLPEKWDRKYKSTYLKKRIGDDSMWAFNPGDCDMNSSRGNARLRQNDLLFTYLDENFPDGPFSFEPNMNDGRFMCIPENVFHQGIALCVAPQTPKLLEIGQLWYPEEYTDKNLSMFIDQVYVAMFRMNPKDPRLLPFLKEYLFVEETPTEESEQYCTFPFFTECVVRFDGPFLDDEKGTTKRIRDAVASMPMEIRRNAEGLIQFINQL